MKPSPYRVREAVGLLDAEYSECVLVGDSTTDVLAGTSQESWSSDMPTSPAKVQALADVQAAAVITDLGEITTALCDTPRTALPN